MFVVGLLTDVYKRFLSLLLIERKTMGGIFGVVSKTSCTLDLFFGIDYHSHLGTKRGGMAVLGKSGFNRSIHNIENTPFRTKFDNDLEELEGKDVYKRQLQNHAKLHLLCAGPGVYRGVEGGGSRGRLHLSLIHI